MTLRMKMHFLSNQVKGIFIFVFLLILSGCGSRQNQPVKMEEKGNALVAPIPVEVSAVKRKDLAVAKTYSGTLEGEDQANIVSKLSERITGISVRVGESVQSGRVIIDLDKSGTSSLFYQAEANFKNAEKTLQRMKSLYEEGAISLQTLDGTQTAFDVAKANFDAARSAVELTTPVSGEVTAINVSRGDLALPGSILVTIARINRMKVVFNINDNDVADIAIGQKVQVFSETRSGLKMDGSIVQLSKSADIRSRSFEIKAQFPNTEDQWFKPGMFCKVEIRLSPHTNVLVIPGASIQTDGLSNRVYMIRQGRAYQRAVQVGITDGENQEILQGLLEGDTVATVGVNNLRDSSLVNIVGKPD